MEIGNKLAALLEELNHYEFHDVLSTEFGGDLDAMKAHLTHEAFSDPMTITAFASAIAHDEDENTEEEKRLAWEVLSEMQYIIALTT